MPLLRERVQVSESTHNGFIRKIRLVLLQEPTASPGIVGFGDRVFQIGLLKRIKRDDDAVYLSQRIVQISLGICCR
jgi:hypothetical protein